MIAHSEHIDQLIARYLAGEALPEEAVQLDDWLDLSEDNLRYFTQMQKVFSEAKASTIQPNYNADAAWSKVKKGMSSVKPQAKVIPLYKRYAALMAAAAVTLVVGLPLMLYYTGILSPETNVALASNEIIGKTYQLTDSSEVVMNRNSVVTYTSKYGKRERRVALKGEAFFAVKHITDKPFVVEANGTLIEDIGTSFNVKAYDSTNTVEVYVESGLVRFYSGKSNGITLLAGQTGIYNKTTNTFTIKGDANKNAIAYKTKQFVFVDTPLEVAIKELCLVYDTKIEVANPRLNQCKITVSFDNENIDSILEIVAETLGLTVEKTSTGYLLKGEGCNH